MTSFTDGSKIPMNSDDVEKAKQLFAEELEKLVVQAKVPQADAMSIDIHAAVDAATRNATRRPVLEEGEEDDTEEYERVFEEKYDGDAPNLLVGLEFPKRFLSICSRSANESVPIPFWEYVLRKLAEGLLENGATSSRGLLNLEEAEKKKLGN